MSRDKDGPVALTAAVASLALLVPLVMSIFEETDFNGLFPLLSLCMAGVALVATRRALRSTPEGTPGHGVAVAAVLTLATSLAILGLLAIVLLLYALSGGN